ncbi:MAG: shikimate kinase [Leptotrichiaceae bacterium]|nr:shikimate kinase [Leptotrichiaceae bacterium]
MKNIVLIGMPASGKSTIGKMLAKKIKYEHYDVDRYLEMKENKRISTIFSEEGEKYFRDLETKYIKELSQKNGVVISTGGGAVKKNKNMEEMKKNGVIIFLSRKVEDIAKENHKYRPLLQNTENIRKLYEERIELYNMYADITVENNNTLRKITDRIAEILKRENII